MFRWLNGPGAVFKDPLPGSTNYLNAYDPAGNLIRARTPSAPMLSRKKGEDVETATAVPHNGLEQNIASGKPIPKETADDLMPFPMNRLFRSQPVLSEELRDKIHKMIQGGISVRTVSEELEVDMQRVGAVYRLKSIENQWIQEGKKLATPYARAVNEMLPKTPAPPNPKARAVPHESINDLPVHSATRNQLFHPVSESMHFNRTSAAKVFARNLLPAEHRIPHPEMVELAKAAQEHRGRDDIVMKRRQELVKAENDLLHAKEERKKAREAAAKKIENPRWLFRFEEIKVESVGKDGRARGGIGARYGVPPQDRKKGQIKIPTRVG
ncbi:MAG: hypothetical protein LQ348_000256 [Seirophora lacunosa]|nr:MAG: hypothetical protein LQ348_000256 [Seirophora lacunosa]